MQLPDSQEADVTAAGRHFIELVRILNRLRDPGGCPWDREQTFTSLRQYLVEETAEALEALDANDLPNLKEELGDVLLQIVFLSRVAAEEGAFTIADVIGAINAKMVHRHPHVFGNVTAESSAEVVQNWEALKAREKKSKAPQGALGEIPAMLPALQRAHTVQRKAKQKGFDRRESDQLWQDIDAGLQKLRSAQSNPASSSPEKNRKEYGAVLFMMAGLGRFFDVEPETALSATTATIYQRLNQAVAAMENSGASFNTMSDAEKSILWQQATAREKS